MLSMNETTVSANVNVNANSVIDFASNIMSQYDIEDSRINMLIVVSAMECMNSIAVETRRNIDRQFGVEVFESAQVCRNFQKSIARHASRKLNHYLDLKIEELELED